MDTPTIRLDLLAETFNWNPSVSINCRKCEADPKIAWPPQAGSYGSTLGHYEAILGRLPAPRSKIRLLVVFQDPRPSDRFAINPPRTDPKTLDKVHHRYFCLTPAAWASLKLDELTGSPTPVWPDRLTAPAYLRRYLIGNQAWSYDGFLAYFFYLLKVESAYVTNIAKCNFGSSSSFDRAFEICTTHYLQTELEIFAPNLILSFTSKLKSVRSISGVTTIQLFHPAAYVNAKSKSDRFSSAIEKSRSQLTLLGIEPSEIIQEWLRDVQTLRPSLKNIDM